MKYEYNATSHPIIIIKKNNKNTYIRVNENLEIIVTTNYFSSKKDIYNLIMNNKVSIDKMIEQRTKKMHKNEKSYFFGQEYKVVYDPIIKNVTIDKDQINAPNELYIQKYLKKEVTNIFASRMQYNYQLFEEKIPYPTLKIRTMKTRWGVCNSTKKQITLNYNLYMYDIICLDYVIIHELCHLIHPNHSNDFWCLVKKYCPNYKTIKKILKE